MQAPGSDPLLLTPYFVAAGTKPRCRPHTPRALVQGTCLSKDFFLAPCERNDAQRPGKALESPAGATGGEREEKLLQ